MTVSEGGPKPAIKALALFVLKRTQGLPDRKIGPLSPRQGRRPSTPRIVARGRRSGAKLEMHRITPDHEFEALRTVFQEN